MDPDWLSDVVLCWMGIASKEELPVRLAHRVKELDELPHDLSAMPSIIKVKEWYAQSFEVRDRHRIPSSILKCRVCWVLMLVYRNSSHSLPMYHLAICK